MAETYAHVLKLNISSTHAVAPLVSVVGSAFEAVLQNVPREIHSETRRQLPFRFRQGLEIHGLHLEIFIFNTLTTFNTC